MIIDSLMVALGHAYCSHVLHNIFHNFQALWHYMFEEIEVW